ncbi:hypothetical protein FJU08_00670 [Martelella alba]|uniref:Uncharacterized protein n=1 Tax=Martelella alba TaxID=2590451 RepID=A0A506UIG3_9HYPH|nr:ankyrin repeat domain-containing protein [Martelella alba]TPW33115.1 hypothetical protein FJU08_00670 [Martelella alba]
MGISAILKYSQFKKLIPTEFIEDGAPHVTEFKTKIGKDAARLRTYGPLKSTGNKAETERRWTNWLEAVGCDDDNDWKIIKTLHDGKIDDLQRGNGRIEYAIAIYYGFHSLLDNLSYADTIDTLVFKEHLRDRGIEVFRRVDDKAISKEPPLWLPDVQPIAADKSNWLSPLVEDALPLTGRETEKKRLTDFALSNRGNFQVWALTGPSGAGKTRLVTEWMREFRKSYGDSNWNIGFLDRDSKEKWRQFDQNDQEIWRIWEPDRPTFIVVDYIHNFADIIAVFFARWGKEEKDGHNSPIHPVRVLLIDHVFPKSFDLLLQDKRFEGISTGGTDFDLKKERFHLSSPLHLEPPDQSRDLLIEILKRASHLHGRVLDTQTVNTVIDELEKIKGAWCPLFAALRGYALATDPGLTFGKRYDLIHYYLETHNRLPWKAGTDAERKSGKWAGCMVAVATALRDSSFADLVDCLPGDLADRDDFDFLLSNIKQQCTQLTSKAVGFELQRLEPDILGESFFILWLREFGLAGRFRQTFFKMLYHADRSQIDRDAKELLSFLRQTARNLGNDDQDDPNVGQSWEALGSVLDPTRLPAGHQIGEAISVAAVYVSEQLRSIGQETLSSRVLGRVAPQSIVRASNGIIVSQAAEALLLFCNRHDKMGKDHQVSNGDLISVLRNFGADHEGGWSGLMLASFLGCLSVAQLLLDCDAEVNQGTTDIGWTALMAACAEGHCDVAQLLLDRDAEVNQGTTDIGLTALMAACQKGHRDVAQLLLDRDAEVNQGTTDIGWTALMAACAEGHCDVAQLLLDRDAEVNQGTTDRGWTALMFACQEGHRDVAQLLLDRDAEVNQGTTDRGWTALMVACAEGHRDVAQLLLDRDAEVNQGTTDSGWTALTFACQEGHRDVAQLLLDRDAEVNQGTTDSGWTALMAACAEGHRDVAQLLLDRDAEVNQGTTDSGWTALMAACAKGHRDVAQLLLDRDAEVNQGTTDRDWTALMFACAKGHRDVAQLLLDQDAEVNQGRTDTGWTALMFACQQGHRDVAQLLLDRDAEVNQGMTDNGGMNRTGFAGDPNS